MFLFDYSDGADDPEFEGTTHLVRVSRMQEAKDATSKTSTVRINIDGMSCQSCVKNIEGTIGSRLGVINIRVILEEKAAYIDYKIEDTSPSELVEAINDMGFDASFSSEYQGNSDSEKNKEIGSVTSTCSIHIDGMTCSSCVNSITGKISSIKFPIIEGLHAISGKFIALFVNNIGVISEKPGVRDINVSLEAKEAKVCYSSGDVTADQIAMYIEEMGFDTFVKEVNGRNYEEPRRTTTNVQNGTVALAMTSSGADDSRSEEKLSKCFLQIKVF